MTWLSLSLLLLFQAGAQAQQKASVTGFVVKMGTGEPVSKAVVTLSPFNGGRAQSFTTTTGSNGQFTLQNLEPGPYRLAATRNGFVRMEYGARSPNRPGLPLTLSAGQRITDIGLQIMQAGTIAGRVFDRDGEPLANVSVEALKYSYQEGQRVMNPVQNVRTNDLGEYRLFWLQPGQYFVSATLPEKRGAGAADDAEGYVPVYYPGTTESQSAAPINLPSGIVFSGVDLTVAAVRTLRVQGQVINGLTGQAARNVNIMLAPASTRRGGGRGGRGGGIRNPGNFRPNINNDGRFEIRGVVPGSYELIGFVNDRNNRMTASVPLEIGNSDVQNVSLVLSPGFTLTGRLAIEGAPNENMARMRVMLRPDSGGQFTGAPPASGVQADGTFTLQQVGRDDYRLTVSGMPQHAYVKAARYGATDVLNEGLRLDRAPSGGLDILVSTNTGIAAGSVQNDKQDASVNVTVVLVPDAARRNRLDLYRMTSTDAAGKFHVEGVPPGDYKVFAWEDVETGAWQDPDFIRTFEDRGKPVRINEGGTSNIDLRVIPPQV